MRFLMLNWRDPKNPKAGGAERVSQAFMKALVQRGHKVWWYANGFEGGADQEVIDGIQIIRGGGSGVSVLRAIQWFRRQSHFDLVIDQHHGIPWFAPWWSNTNCIAYIHEVLGPIWEAFYPWPVSTFGQWQERWTHWWYRKVPFWVPSESTKTALAAHGVREVQVLPNGTDTVPLAQLEDKSLQLPLRIIAVSRLAPNKRVDHAIEATRILLQKGLKAHLTVVGGGESEQELKRAASVPELAGHITFTGQIKEEQKNERLREAHFLVHTSLREGWGLNVIEANAMGTPAVVYPVGGLVDSTVNGQTGMVSEQETPESLADRLLEIVKVPAEYDRLRHNAWERSKSFVWEQVIPLTCEWLEHQAKKGTNS